MPAGYSFTTEGAEALAAATAETLLNLVNATNGIVRIPELSVSFDGIVATAVPVLIELMNSTQSVAGTSSAATIRQLRGPTRTVQATARHSYTVEPEVLTELKSWLLTPNGGLLVIQFPLGREPEQHSTADGLALRLTAPAGVNARGYMEFEEG